MCMVVGPSALFRPLATFYEPRARLRRAAGTPAARLWRACGALGGLLYRSRACWGKPGTVPVQHGLGLKKWKERRFPQGT